jgi:7-cyano-7-deazaguanine synthase
MSKKAVILFSGGLDSTTCLAMVKSQGFECYPLTFHYGQKHSVEVEKAKSIASQLGVTEHKVMRLTLNEMGGSALTDNNIAVPDYEGENGIPVTYVPARNTIFLTYALAWAEVLNASDIFIGINDVDYSGYPDCRPEYFQAFEVLANLATKAGVEGNRLSLHAPLLRMKKDDIIKKGLELGVDYSLTVSCYRADAEGRACGTCDSCTYRKNGFSEAGIADPTLY